MKGEAMASSLRASSVGAWSVGRVCNRFVSRCVVIGAVAAWAMGGAVGCASSSTDEDLMMTENTELRERLNEAEASLAACQDENSALSTQNDDLALALTQAQAELEAGRGTTRGGTTAFSGIEGTETFQRGDAVVVSVAGDVLFASGQATLRNQSKQTLDRIASVISSSYPGNLIRIEGYTDSDPIRRSKWKSNEHLSAERAITVEKYLVSRGVNNDRIYSAAFGPSNPRGTKQQSRRVEIVVLAQGG